MGACACGCMCVWVHVCGCMYAGACACTPSRPPSRILLQCTNKSGPPPRGMMNPNPLAFQRAAMPPSVGGPT